MAADNWSRDEGRHNARIQGNVDNWYSVFKAKEKREMNEVRRKRMWSRVCAVALSVMIALLAGSIIVLFPGCVPEITNHDGDQITHDPWYHGYGDENYEIYFEPETELG